MKVSYWWLCLLIVLSWCHLVGWRFETYKWPRQNDQKGMGEGGTPSPIGLLVHKRRSLGLSHLPHVMTKLKGDEAIIYNENYKLFILKMYKQAVPWQLGDV